MRKIGILCMIILVTACSNQKEVVDNNLETTKSGEVTVENIMIDTEVGRETSLEEMIQKKYYINVHGVIYNAEIKEAFLQNQADDIMFVLYTIEGDPILYSIKRKHDDNGNSYYIVCMDTTRDSYGEKAYFLNVYQTVTIEDKTMHFTDLLPSNTSSYTLENEQDFIINTIEELFI